MTDCTELNNLREDVELIDTPANRTKFLSNYVDAYLACNPGQQEELIMSVDEGSDPSSIAKAIAEDMGREEDESLELDLLDQLVQINESKRPISGDTQKDDKSHLAADPVMLFKGQFTHEVEDIQISGAGIDFIFKRTYKNQVIFNGPLGYNWTHNFHIWLRVSDQTIFRSTGDLREELFARHPRFGEAINGDFDYWMPPDGKHGVIFAEGESFVLRLPNGSHQIFEPDPNHSFLHRLTRIEDRFGNYLDLIYADNQLVQVEINHPQRLISFEYDPQGHICLIRDYTGREWNYRYDSFGDLITVTSPVTDRYKSGLTVYYDYSSAFQTGELQHNLIRIIDAAGQIYLENEYGTSQGLRNFNRVVRQRQGGGEYNFEYKDIDQIFDFDYPDELRPTHQTTLVERNGQPVRHIYNKFGNLLLREQSIIKNGLPYRLTEQYRYNRDGNTVASLSPEGVLTQYLFGHDYFVHQHGLTANGDVPTNRLTWKERQAFGRIRATVRRGGYANFDSFTFTQGIWGNFPDIFNGPFPTTMSDRSQDIIIKMTYENEFGQLLTVSDPRYTNSANPDEPNEHTRYSETLTRYVYSGPTQLLIRIEYPTPILPDGTLATEVIEKFTKPDPNQPNIEIPAYDTRGRLERVTNPIGVVTEYTYFDNPNDVSLGYLQQTDVDPDGLNITTQNEVDELGRIIAIRLPKSVGLANDQFVIRTVFNELDQIIETTSPAPFNFKTRRFYDRNGNLEREEKDLRDENGQPELGGLMVSTFCYDEEFNLVEETVGGIDMAAHLVTKYCYDNTGKKVLTILPNGNQIRIHYDERQLPVAQVSGAGSEDSATIRTNYDGDGRVYRSFNARSNETTYDFDAFGRVIAEEDPLGHITRTNYDKAGNVTCVRVFEKRDDNYYLLARSETNYDELNRTIRNAVNRFEDPIGPFQYPQLNDSVLSSPGPGNLLVTKTFYDGQDRIERIVDPLGRETRYHYDALDRVSVVIDPLGNETHNQYDAHNNLTRTDQRDRILDENGVEIGLRIFPSSSSYNELDRLTSSTDSLGNITYFFYDSRGNIVRQVDPLGNELRNSFDVFNRPIATTRFLTATGLGPVTPNAIPVTTAQEYDRNGNLTAVIDALGRYTHYLYDALDRRKAIIYPDKSRMLTDYDDDGNVIRTQDNNGLQRLYTVDALDRTTHVEIDKSRLPTTLEVAGATFERYEYDGLDRQTVAENDFAICTYRYNSLSWPLTETIQFNTNEAPIQTPFTIIREFNNVGALVGLTYPSGRQLQLDRDELNRLVNLQNLANGNGYPGDPSMPDNRQIARMTYAGQQRDRCLFANDTNTTYHHDGAGRVIEIAHANLNESLLAIQYLYDAASNVRVRNDVLPTSSRTERFAYDSVYRLAHEFKPDTTETFILSTFRPADGPLANPLPDRQSAMTALIGSLELPQTTHTYDYDLVGNRKIERLADGSSINYEINQLDQYTSRNGTSYTHDANGNLKNNQQRRYTYDSLNRLVGVHETNGSKIAQFWHDAFGRRILEQIGEGTTQLICNGNDVITEYRDGNLFAQYVFDDGVDRPLQIAVEDNEYWYHADLVRSVRLLTNQIGDKAKTYKYNAFGDEMTEVPTGGPYNLLRYVAHRMDEDLISYDFRARQYDPQSGRFLQRDPNGMVDGSNLYVYATNNSLSFVDLFGTERKEVNKDSSNFLSFSDDCFVDDDCDPAFDGASEAAWNAERKRRGLPPPSSPSILSGIADLAGYTADLAGYTADLAGDIFVGSVQAVFGSSSANAPGHHTKTVPRQTYTDQAKDVAITVGGGKIIGAVAGKVIRRLEGKSTNRGTPSTANVNNSSRSRLEEWNEFRSNNAGRYNMSDLRRAYRDYKAGIPGDYLTKPPSLLQRGLRLIYDDRDWNYIAQTRNKGLLTHKGYDWTWEHFFIKQRTAKKYPFLRGFANSYSNTFLRIPRALNSKIGNDFVADIRFKLTVGFGVAGSGKGGYELGDYIIDTYSESEE